MRVDYDEWDADELEYGEEQRKPFFMIADNDDEIKKWMDEEFAYRVKKSRGRISEYEENLAYWKGVQYKNQFSDRDSDVSETTTKNPKIVDNLVFETLEEKIAKMIRYRPAIAVLPANSEWNDDMAAVSVKQMIDTRWYDVGINDLFTDDQFYTFLYGTSIIYTFWDDEEGPENPTVERALKLNNKKAKELKGLRAGDVNYEVIPPDRFFPERKESWGQVDNTFYIKYRCPYELSKEYPDAQIDPEAIIDTDDNELELEDNRKNRNKVLTRYFFHRPTKFLPEGVKIISINGKVLSKEEYEHPSSDGKAKLPFVLHTDIKEPKSYWGRSYIRLIKQAQDQHNGLSSAAARSFAMASVPKWFVPWGSCDTKTLTNGHTLIRYKGGREPRMIAFNPISREVFEQQDRLKTSIDRKSKVYNIYRRDQKIDLSGLALQHLDEQENEAVSVAINRRAKVFLDVANLTKDLMSENYKGDTERMKKIFGDDDTFVVEQFDSKVFSSKYSIRLQNAPALPQHKSSRMQMMLEVNEKHQGLVQRETFLDLLGLAKNKQYMDMVTVSSKAANYENELMLRGGGIPEPKPWEGHFVHYESHVKKLEERIYKSATPRGVKMAFKKHIKGTEYLMWIKARENPAFRQKLMEIDYYPIFFKIPEKEVAMINRMAMGGSLAEGESAALRKDMQGAGYQPVVEEGMEPPINPLLAEQE
ncbi:MAG: hypothetical protein KAJ40_00575 [Alphaproteobacteria bacterium]|nr:hypothetical protein [Alphaproteobacteria bacterium]